MINVTPQPEPDDFDGKVRIPGRRWLLKKGISLGDTPPNPPKLLKSWTKVLKELWESYEGICAYLCIFLEWSSGEVTTDHYIAKSRDAGKAYEWSNYRLCCHGMNRKKGDYNDVLDPFEIADDTFIIDFFDGEMIVNPLLPPEINERAEKTILRLKLNDPDIKKMRKNQYIECKKGSVSLARIIHKPVFKIGTRHLAREFL